MSNITMQHIAEMARVSKSTVSRALSNDPRVSEDTREKINKIARELNYRPNQVAQALAKKSTNIIGFILPYSPRPAVDPFLLEFIQGISEIATSKGYSLILPKIDRNHREDWLKIFNKNKLDGLILTQPELDDPRINILRREEIPFVFIGNPMENDDICWVETDNEIGAYQAVRYLIDCGHKKIATIAGPIEMVSGKYRLEGYIKALRDAEIEIDYGLIYYADFTQQSAYKAAKRLLKSRRDFTAVFVANDLMAISAIKALKEEKIRIPNEIAVMGYDGVQFGELIDPPLSTIKLPGIKMGKVAANMLLRMINGQKIKIKQVLLPPKLIIRGST